MPSQRARVQSDGPLREPLKRGRPRGVSICRLEIAGEEAAQLVEAMQVVGTEPIPASQRPSVAMPRFRTESLADLDKALGRCACPPPGPDSADSAKSVPLKLIESLRHNPGAFHCTVGLVQPGGKQPSQTAVAATAAAVSRTAKASQLDPCLVRLIAVWSKLPTKVRTAIEAIVNSVENRAPANVTRRQTA